MDIDNKSVEHVVDSVDSEREGLGSNRHKVIFDEAVDDDLGDYEDDSTSADTDEDLENYEIEELEEEIRLQESTLKTINSKLDVLDSCISKER